LEAGLLAVVPCREKIVGRMQFHIWYFVYRFDFHCSPILGRLRNTFAAAMP
jgi:hypothetical protein